MDHSSGQIMSRAAARAREDGCRTPHPDHVLLAVAELPSPARDVLVDAGLTPERLAEAMAERDADGERNREAEFPGAVTAPPAVAPSDESVVIGPGLNRLLGWVGGFAAAGPGGVVTHEHWLLAMIYLEPLWLSKIFDRTGGSATELVAALRQRGARVPHIDPPGYQPWRGRHHIDVPTAEMKALLKLLAERYPPSTQTRWAFTAWPDDPGRSRVYAEEGVDLPGLAAAAREQAEQAGPNAQY